ncbi:MAG: ImmA/IrrE family metallo-endopeptidase [Chlorobium sp.]|jgi:Zn-dependent peptidase ImmA (M78 family)|nr:ImmA/IrrE family metallo-endopeptidase [Chlorobium sp.]
MKVAVNAQVLEWALDRSLRRESLEQKFPKLSGWRDGDALPTFRQLHDFAKAAAVPFGYLLLQAPPVEQLPIANFRTVSGESGSGFSPELIDTIQAMQRRQVWMREYLIAEGHDRLPFVGSDRIDTDPVMIARNIRGVLGIDENWAANQPNWSNALSALIRLVELAGIMVISNGIVENNTHRKLDPQEFRGFVLVDDYAPLVFLNGADGKAARMFTLAHELAHIWIGVSAAFDLRELQPADNENERACNRIAAEFLVPSVVLAEVWPQVHGRDNPFQLLAKRFKVSEIVAARRLLDMGFIARAEFMKFYRAWQDQEQRLAKKAGDDGGGDFYANQNIRIGNRFGDLLTRSVQAGTTLYTDAWRLTGLKKNTFQEYAQKIFGRSV